MQSAALAWEKGICEYFLSIMSVCSTSRPAISPTCKQLQSHTTCRLFALQSPSTSSKYRQSWPAGFSRFRRQRVHQFSCRHKVSASTYRHCRAPHASASNTSAEPGPKVVGLGLACWDFLAQVASFPKPDEKLRTQRMEVLLWHICHHSNFESCPA